MGEGSSGYFSAPAATLDPALFDGQLVRSNVRNMLLGKLHYYLTQWYSLDNAWLHAWVAGSGVTYQWAADRGNGDLDVLFSIDVAPFIRANQQFAGWGETSIVEEINARLKTDAWPQLANSHINGKTFEVTYFWNVGTRDDIRNIHVYAAYDLTGDRWAIRPPQLPENPALLYPASWGDASDGDAQAAKTLWNQYQAAIGGLNVYPEGSIPWHDAGRNLNHVTQQARSLFDSIHYGRHAAFTDQGTGYGDYANYRWQRAKQSGAVRTLSAIAQVGETARRAEETEKYGAPIDAADVAARRAALWRSQR
jgi:hypothetical protein